MGEVSVGKGDEIKTSELSWEEKIALCEQWKMSGVKKSHFCKQNKLAPSTFYGWCQKLWSSHKTSNELCAVRVVGNKKQSVLPSQDMMINVELNFAGQVLMRVDLSEAQIKEMIKELSHATTVTR